VSDSLLVDWNSTGNAAAAVRYVYQNPSARLIDKNMAGRDPNHHARMMGAVAQLNRSGRLQRQADHYKLSTRQSHSPSEWKQLCRGFIEEMDGDLHASQYVAVLHEEGNHLHLVRSRVGRDLRPITDSGWHEYRTRNAAQRLGERLDWLQPEDNRRGLYFDRGELELMRQRQEPSKQLAAWAADNGHDEAIADWETHDWEHFSQHPGVALSEMERERERLEEQWQRETARERQHDTTDTEDDLDESKQRETTDPHRTVARESGELDGGHRGRDLAPSESDDDIRDSVASRLLESRQDRERSRYPERLESQDRGHGTGTAGDESRDRGRGDIDEVFAAGLLNQRASDGGVAQEGSRDDANDIESAPHAGEPETGATEHLDRSRPGGGDGRDLSVGDDGYRHRIEAEHQPQRERDRQGNQQQRHSTGTAGEGVRDATRQPAGQELVGDLASRVSEAFNAVTNADKFRADKKCQYDRDDEGNAIRGWIDGQQNTIAFDFQTNTITLTDNTSGEERLRARSDGDDRWLELDSNFSEDEANEHLQKAKAVRDSQKEAKPKQRQRQKSRGFEP